MIYYIWHNLLFLPLVNILIYLYVNFAFSNYALAIAELVVLMRIFLLPLTFIEEKNKNKYKELTSELERVDKYYATDIIKKNEIIRATFKRNKIKPWAKILSLAIQGFVMLLFYTVNNKALHNLDNLYSFVPVPEEAINTLYFGQFDIIKPSIILSSICAIYFFGKIIIEQSKRFKSITEEDKLERYLLPLFLFIILVFLPATKSIFVLSSMLFSTIVHNLQLFMGWTFGKKKERQVESVLNEVTKPSFVSDPWKKFKK